MELSRDAKRFLIFLAPSFLAFRVYMIDADRCGLRQLDIVFGGPIFLVFSYGGYLAFNLLGGPNNLFWLIAFTFTCATVLAVLWNCVGHATLHRLLNALKITNEDNRGDVWGKIFNGPWIYVSRSRCTRRTTR